MNLKIKSTSEAISIRFEPGKLQVDVTNFVSAHMLHLVTKLFAQEKSHEKKMEKSIFSFCSFVDEDSKKLVGRGRRK